MPNKITNTGIVHRSYNARSIVVHRSVSDPLVRATDGVLWSAVRTGASLKEINIFKSIDNGFSWNNVYSGTFLNAGTTKAQQFGLNHNGSHLFLQLFEGLEKLILLHSAYNSFNGQYVVERLIFDTNDMTIAPVQTNIALDQDYEAISATYNDHMSFIVSANFSEIYVDSFRPTDTSTSVTGTLSGDYFNMIDSNATFDGKVDIVAVNDAVSYYDVKYTRYNSSGNSFTTPVLVSRGGTQTVSDVNIARDGNDNLIVAWAQETSTPSLEIKYSLSDDGITWSTPVAIDYTAGHSPFTDGPTGQLSARLNVLGGIGGFMLSYTRNNSDGVAKTYVRKLGSSDGSIYVLDDEQEIATQSAGVTDKVTGARFFQAPATRIVDIADPGQVRVGFQIGEGNSTTQADTSPVTVGQELLSQSAYPTVLASDLSTYEIDPIASNQLLANLHVLAGPSEEDDYYALGMIGPVTERYVSAFNRVGTETRILKYEPTQQSQMNDRSAYTAPVEYVSKIVLDAMTYDSPLENKSSDSFSTYVERDVRKIYLPPTFHLSRTRLLNNGNFLKRTVWTVYFDGNEYEISQVVPFFLDNKICYYSANAYVVGASNDPFSRTILPTET